MSRAQGCYSEQVDFAEQQGEVALQVAGALEPLAALRLAYLFGSRAAGTARPDSDLDVAIQVDRKLDGNLRGAVLLDVLDALATKLGPLGERADVLDLDRASPTIAFRVIREGRLVLCRDARDRIRLETRVGRMYDDTRHYRELFQRAARSAAERMKRGSLVDPDVIARRLLTLNETLERLSAVRDELDADRLAADKLLQAAVERWLQVALDVCIDLAYHIIADRGWAPPDSARGAFEQLAASGLISPELATRLGRAAGMRNILVHDYVRVDREILIRGIDAALTDLPAFGAIVGGLIEAD
jgi:uncharacterized protein YutE (UPF0331/DUF86 family)/predicted nucleotidyltransferase